jgi:RNA recognition motif. (a.k.a. RRM, RBD, or RNP domain)
MFLRFVQVYSPLNKIQTGKSKHYGFIEFESSSVAKIVSETMDNYLLHGHLLQCKIIPKDEVHPQLWVGANRKWRPVPSGRLAMAKHNKVGVFCGTYSHLLWLTFSIAKRQGGTRSDWKTSREA